MSRFEQTVSHAYVDVECGECSIKFWLPEPFCQELRETGALFSCPRGHRRRFTTSQEITDKAKLEADNKRLRLLLTKLHEGATTGRCPVCNRLMSNLQYHIVKKHPAYAEKVPA